MAHAEVEERQLLKAMTWWDGFVVALANPGFLIAALGSSIGALGTTGAFVLWTISITFGALQNNIHAELATMFPNKSGGIALYAHEAWRKYLTFVGPVATFGYWIGWSVVLSINGLVAGTLIQAEWFSDNTWTKSGAGFDLSLPIVIGMGLIVLVWLFNIYGVRPAVWFGYLTGALLCIPVFVLMFFPYITGDWHSSNMDWNIGTGGGLPLVLTWLYFMCWSSYGIEVVATFAPEYHDTQRDTPKALRSAALFSVAVYALLPLGLGGTLGTQAVADDTTFIAFYTQAFDKLVGNGLGNVMIACIVGGLVLSMNTATMDGSRALYGISKDGMTIRELGVLNRFHVPGRAMTIDAILNIFLITYFTGVLGSSRSATSATSSRPAVRSAASCCCAGTGRTGRARSGSRGCGCRSRACCLRSTWRCWSPAGSSTPAASSGSTATATAGTRPASVCSSSSPPSSCTSTATWCRTRSRCGCGRTSRRRRTTSWSIPSSLRPTSARRRS
jgi:amino acid transporter